MGRRRGRAIAGMVLGLIGAIALGQAAALGEREPRGSQALRESHGPRSSQAPGPLFGMQAVPKFDERTLKGSWSGTRDRGMAMHRDLGVELSREGMIWRLYQPAGDGRVPHQRDFDDAVRRLDEAGIALQFMVTETPYWASTGKDKRPNDPGSYKQAPPEGLYRPIFTDGTDVPGTGKRINPDHPWASFLETVVRRYKGKVRYWQCWNEPDYPKGVLQAAPGDPARSWQGSVREYVRLLAVMHTVVKWIDPAAKVVTGGLGYAGYLQAMIDHGAAPYFDLVDFHAYGWPGSDEALRSFLSVHQAMRHVLERNGLASKGMMCSETGYSATEPIVQADYIVKLYATTLALGVEGSIWYSNTNPSWRSMGLVDWRSLTQRTAGYWAYKNASTALAGMRFVRKLSLPPQAVGYLYRDPHGSREVAVLWAPYRTPDQTLSVSWDRKGSWQAVTPGGDRRKLDPGETLRLHASPLVLDSDPARPYAQVRPNPPLARNGVPLRGVTASGSSDDGFHGPDLAVDGDTDSQWIASGFRAASASITLELDGRRPLRELRLKTGPMRGSQLAIQVSDDGRHWRTVREGVSIASWQLERLPLNDPVEASWVRLLWRNTPDRMVPRLEIFELEVHE